MRKILGNSGHIYTADKANRYEVFNNGNLTGSFITNPDDSLYIGDVWPGYTVFPDWLSRGAGKWWSDEMTAWHDKVAFDGAWIDMSEVKPPFSNTRLARGLIISKVSSFCAGSCGSGGNITLKLLAQRGLQLKQRSHQN